MIMANVKSMTLGGKDVAYIDTPAGVRLWTKASEPVSGGNIDLTDGTVYLNTVEQLEANAYTQKTNKQLSLKGNYKLVKGAGWSSLNVNEDDETNEIIVSYGRAQDSQDVQCKKSGLVFDTVTELPSDSSYVLLPLREDLYAETLNSVQANIVLYDNDGSSISFEDDQYQLEIDSNNKDFHITYYTDTTKATIAFTLYITNLTSVETDKSWTYLDLTLDQMTTRWTKSGTTSSSGEGYYYPTTRIGSSFYMKFSQVIVMETGYTRSTTSTYKHPCFLCATSATAGTLTNMMSNSYTQTSSAYGYPGVGFKYQFIKRDSDSSYCRNVEISGNDMLVKDSDNNLAATITITGIRVAYL